MSLLSAPEAARDRSLARDAAATFALLALVGGAAGLSLCRGRGAPDAEAACARILDRYVEMRQFASDPKAPHHLVEEKKEDARKVALQGGALLRCASSLSAESAACAEKAHSADELERCFP